MRGARPTALIAGSCVVLGGAVAILAAGFHVASAAGALVIVLGAAGLAYWVESRDTLTGTLSRMGFVQRVSDGLLHCQQWGGAIAVLSVDVERFRAVNATHGQAAGDLVLKELATRMRKHLPRSALIARMSADEFLVAVMGDAEEGVTLVCERFCDLLRDSLGGAPISLPYGEIFVRVRVGGDICTHECGRMCAEELVTRANVARRGCHGGGSGPGRGFAHYRPGTAEASSRAARIECEMPRALHAGEFAVAYQPIIDVRQMRIAKCEALLRWTSPRLGEISPQEFIPIAEASGLIEALGQFVIDEVCAQLGQWRAVETGAIVACVNVSAIQMRNPSFASSVLSSLVANGVAPERLALEITEGVVVGDDPAIGVNLRYLRRAGIRVYLDDFGTGFSSLSCLAKLDVHGLKIDQSFVQAMSENSADMGRARRLVEAICALASAMDLDLVAEGVDAPWKAEELARMGVGLMQGFLYSPAVPPERLSGLDFMLAGDTRLRSMLSSPTLQ